MAALNSIGSHMVFSLSDPEDFLEFQDLFLAPLPAPVLGTSLLWWSVSPFLPVG